MNYLSTIEALISRLRNESGSRCLSVVIPFGAQDDMDTKQLKIKRQLSQASRYLEQQPADLVRRVEAAIPELIRDVHYDRTFSGIGLFFSQGISEVFPFIFPVKAKLTVGDKFELSDLLLHAQYARPGYILQLNGKGAHLYLAGPQEVQEIREDPFPLAYSEEYTYTHPARAASTTGHAVVQQCEKDKHALQEAHYENFLRQVDRPLSSYLHDSPPLVIAGPSRVVTAFESLTAFKHLVVGVLPGNYSRSGVFELHQLSRHFFLQQVEDQIKAAIRQVAEKKGVDLAAEGIVDCWSAAVEGKGLLLLVEKDYNTAGFLQEGNDATLYLDAPRQKHRIVTNAVNELIHAVLSRKGQVLVTHPDALREHRHVALLKRYP